MPVCPQAVPARNLSRRIAPFGALSSWRHFPGGHIPCARSFSFKVLYLSYRNHFTEKTGPPSYVQNVGKPPKIPIFPRFWNRVIMGAATSGNVRERGHWMHYKLTIPERLQDLRKERHLTLEQLAEQTGLSKSALGKYESDDYKDISPFAIATLAEFYGVSADYLMGLAENKNHPDTELQTLHLSDDMVELLSSRKINNRLLCELATHPDFQRFMTDMEIFIDRIADMRVEQMNPE